MFEFDIFLSLGARLGVPGRGRPQGNIPAQTIWCCCYACIEKKNYRSFNIRVLFCRNSSSKDRDSS